jgi:deleted in liver cancer protein
MILLDDENRDALKVLLKFLHSISINKENHKMDNKNIAICFAPSLINMNNLKDSTFLSNPLSPVSLASSTSSTPIQTPTQPQSQSQITNSFNQNNYGLSSDITQQLNRQCNASCDCIAKMINNYETIFNIPNEATCHLKLQNVNRNEKKIDSLPSLDSILNCTEVSLNSYLNDRFDEMLKEVKSNKNWTSQHNSSSLIEIYSKNINQNDDSSNHPLKLWKASIEIDASPDDIRQTILNSQMKWRNNILEGEVINKINSQTDVLKYVINSMEPLPKREFYELRCCRVGAQLTSTSSNSIPKSYSCGIFCKSVETPISSENVRGCTFNDFYLIESLSSSSSSSHHYNNKKNRCKLHQIYRADYW